MNESLLNNQMNNSQNKSFYLAMCQQHDCQNFAIVTCDDCSKQLCSIHKYYLKYNWGIKVVCNKHFKKDKMGLCCLIL